MSYAKFATPSHILYDVENYVADLTGAGISSSDSLSTTRRLTEALRKAGVGVPLEPSSFEQARIDRLQAWHKLLHGNEATPDQLVKFENSLLETSSHDPLLIAKHTLRLAHNSDVGRSSSSVFDMRRLAGRLQQQLDERGHTITSAMDEESALARRIAAITAAETIANFFKGAAETGEGELLGRLKAFDQLGITPLQFEEPSSTLNRDQLRHLLRNYERAYEEIRIAIYPEIEDLIATYKYPSAINTRKQSVAQSAFLSNPRALLVAAGWDETTVENKLPSRNERDAIFANAGMALALRDVNKALKTRVQVVGTWIEADSQGLRKGPFTDFEIAKAEETIEAYARAIEYVTVDISKEIDTMMSETLSAAVGQEISR